MDLKELDVLGSSVSDHWYYATKAMAMARMLDGIAVNRVLDVGAGSGFFSQYLLQHTDAREAWCIDPSYPNEFDERVGEKPIHYRCAIEKADTELVLLMDVLEHVDDDRGLVAEYASKVRTGTSFLITVPAFQSLWSQHDDFLDHRRRYTLHQMETTLRQAGLVVSRGCYFFAGVLPMAAGIRLLQRNLTPKEPRSQLRKHSWPTNKLLKTICMAELSCFKWNRLAGLSVVCLAQKP
jgi:SAM-dependent methyltransferase